MDLKSYLKKKKSLVDRYLKEYLSDKNKNSSCPEYLYDSMDYSLMAGGKRLRPILAIACYETSGLKSKNILPAAAAIELIHTYSLIHDDLPSMDNDDFRRSKPTNHRVFGEAIAILAGDALLTDAFGIIANLHAESATIIKIIRELTHAAGSNGMVGGQAADIAFEDKKIRKRDLIYIHTHKTGALIRASLSIGAIMADVPPEKYRLLTVYGEKIGLAFQIMDDVLDLVSTTDELGKTARADISRGKNTYPSVFGLNEAKKKASSLVKEALKSLDKFDSKADPLREIAKYIINRRN